ncbi:MAG: hypothetical protein IT558_04730 [Alphaproteobacteria bacterium]|nr:hypothetical protein [Alphaproteobacteria bacterium]
MPEAALKTPDIIESVIAKTIEYISYPCVVGYEQFFLNHLNEEYMQAGLETWKHEGLLEIRGKKPHSAIICAHIDRHGLISIGDGEYVYAAQYIKEIKYGQNNRQSQKEIAGIIKRFEGERVLAYDPATGATLGTGLIKAGHPWLLHGDAVFEVEGLNKLDLGLPLAYARTARIEQDYLKGQIDNALSLAIISALYENGFEGTALLSTEEEIGKSWVHLAGALRRIGAQAKDLIILDTSPYVEPEPVDQGMVIFRSRDMSASFNTDLLAAMKDRAADLSIPCQVKDEMLLAKGRTPDQLGSTELGKLIQHTNGEWSGATVQIPTLMYHTSNETTSIAAVTNFYNFLHDILIDDPLPFSTAMLETVRG